LNPSPPQPQRSRWIAPLFLVTATFASTLGAGSVALLRSGEVNIFGIRVTPPPIANWLGGEQSFPPREGWPVSKTADQELDPADPSIPDLVLQQIRSHPQDDSAAAIRNHPATTVERPIQPSPIASPSAKPSPEQSTEPGNLATPPEGADPDRPQPDATASPDATSPLVDRSPSGDRLPSSDRSPSGSSADPEPEVRSTPERRPAPERPTSSEAPAPERPAAAPERRSSGGSGPSNSGRNSSPGATRNSSPSSGGSGSGASSGAGSSNSGGGSATSPDQP
jgi:uncharacterized membrane protein YgcG